MKSNHSSHITYHLHVHYTDPYLSLSHASSHHEIIIIGLWKSQENSFLFFFAKYDEEMWYKK
jgi:hypothetical protein